MWLKALHGSTIAPAPPRRQGQMSRTDAADPDCSRGLTRDAIDCSRGLTPGEIHASCRVMVSKSQAQVEEPAVRLYCFDRWSTPPHGDSWRG